MSFRGRGRGGFRGGGFGRGQQLPSEKFPEIEGLGKGEYNESKKQLIMWSRDLQNFWKVSPYYYKPAKKVEKLDIERYSDRQQGATNKKRPLEHYIFMDVDHLPGELAKEGGGARVAKNVRWDIGFDEAFKKIEERAKGREKEAIAMMKAEEEDKEEDEDDEVNDDDEEREVDDNEDDDYGVGEHFEDDEDDYNVDDDGNDNEGIY